MPALLATCTKCGYRFTFDYDFRQVHCQKCRANFDWKENPVEGSSFHAEFGSETASYGGETPKLPGEAGYEQYEEKARREKYVSVEKGKRFKGEP